MYARYVELRDLAGVKDAEVAKNVGIAQSTFTDWKKGRSSPKMDKLVKIAGFFGVSVDYFTEPQEEHKQPQETLSHDERELLRLFRLLSSSGRAEALKRVSELVVLQNCQPENTSSRAG